MERNFEYPAKSNGTRPDFISLRFRTFLKPVPTRFYDRAALKAGTELEGPAIVNQYDSTTVIPPGLTARIDRCGNIVIGTGVAAEAEAVTAAEVSR